MSYILVQHTVLDYDTWRPHFDRETTRRAAAGGRGSSVYRDADQPNQLTVLLEWDTVENARRFAEDPALKEVMEAAGVSGAPRMTFLNDA